MKKSLLLIFLVAIVLTGCASKNNPAVTLDQQKECATLAKTFMDNHQDTSPWFTFSFTNHFNQKMNKCFILIQSYNSNTDFLSYDLYDALENKHYAMYIGHSNCDITTLSFSNEPKKCQLDWGVIWLNGDDTWSPDTRVGFVWMANGTGVGDENTQNQFMELIKPFMNE